jgi:predicted  nucleic acid-binding Zn-ribbon protein
MDQERQTLEAKIDELRNRLERLEEEWETLSSRVSRMTVSKLTDPRHPLIDWELHHFSSDAEHVRFHATMAALQNRLNGVIVPENEQIEIDGIARTTLYSSTPPTIAEIIEALKLVTHGTERSVLKLMEVAKEEFAYDYEDLADFVLESFAR